MVGDITVSDTSLAVQINLTIVGCPAADTIEAHTRAALLAVAGERTLDLTLGVTSPQQQDRPITEGRINLLRHDVHRLIHKDAASNLERFTQLFEPSWPRATSAWDRPPRITAVMTRASDILRWWRNVSYVLRDGFPVS